MSLYFSVHTQVVIWLDLLCFLFLNAYLVLWISNCLSFIFSTNWHIIMNTQIKRSDLLYVLQYLLPHVLNNVAAWKFSRVLIEGKTICTPLNSVTSFCLGRKSNSQKIMYNTFCSIIETVYWFYSSMLGIRSYIWGSSPYASLLDRIESKAIHLIGDPSLTSTLDPLSLRRKVASISSTAITLVTALKNWLPVFHLRWLSHVPHGRHHLATTIVWNSSMRELIDSVMVSSLLLPAFGTLSLFLYFWLPSTFLQKAGLSPP